VFFADVAGKSTLSRAVSQGRVRRLAREVYTADLSADPARLVLKNRWEILAYLVPDAMIADRSAATDGEVAAGALFVVSNQRSRPVPLPGLVIRPRPGPGPLSSDLSWAAGLHITSAARAVVDNLGPSLSRAGRQARTLSRAELGDWLVRKAQVRPRGWLDQLRVQVLIVADELGVPDRKRLAERLFDEVAGTKPPLGPPGRLLAGRLGGKQFDMARVERFETLSKYLAAIPPDLEVPAALAPSAGDSDGTLPFFEAYFSNFIEGTEFGIEEAEAIVASGTAPVNRPADAHDILGTFRVVSDPVGRSTVPATAEDLLELLSARHGAIMEGRPDKGPGQFKTKANQAGTYVFVEPDLVVGTLSEGFRYAEQVPPGFARSLYALFLVSEVHPFDDGNGRIARCHMCAELSAARMSRLIVPTVLRNEYVQAMRQASRPANFELYVRTLAWAWRWTAAMPWADREATLGRLVATNALMDSTDAEQTGSRLELP
jgi:hypothetical protein